MTHGFSKVIALIAASGIGDREILDFAEELRRRGSKDFVYRVKRTRELIETSTYDDSPVLMSAGMLSTATNDLEEKIGRLLLMEARLTKIEAMTALTDEVLKRHPGVFISVDPKRGFSHWISKVVETVSPSELLFLATAIRNKYVHESPSDWRLK